MTSESRRLRSSASTWICTRNTLAADGAHSTSISRSGWLSSDSALVQSARCTETPLPRVTKPMIGSPGTGVQQRASLTHTSAVADDDDARVAAAAGASPGSGVVASARSSLGALLAAHRLRPGAARRAGRTRGPRPPPRTARRCRRSAARRPGRSASRAVISRCSGRPCLRIALAMASLPESIASSRRSLENHWRILLRARGLLTNVSQSRDGPGAVGLGGEDLDDVAVLQRALQRHQPAVDPRRRCSGARPRCARRRRSRPGSTRPAGR